MRRAITVLSAVLALTAAAGGPASAAGNEILRKASIFFAGELDPRHR